MQNPRNSKWSQCISQVHDIVQYMDVECKGMTPLVKIMFYSYVPSPPNSVSEVPLLWALFLYNYFQNVEN